MKLGERLRAAGVIDAAQLGAGLDRARTTGERLGAALIALGHATGDEVAAALAAEHRTVAARDRQLAHAPTALASRLPAAVAHRLRAVVLAEGRDRELVIALADPHDPAAIDALESATGHVVVPAAASVARLGPAIARLYPGTAATELAAAARAAPIAPAADIATAARAAADALATAGEATTAALAPPPEDDRDPVDLEAPVVVAAPPAPAASAATATPHPSHRPHTPTIAPPARGRSTGAIPVLGGATGVVPAIGRTTASVPALARTSTQTVAGGTSLAAERDDRTGSGVGMKLIVGATIVGAVAGGVLYLRSTRDRSFAVSSPYTSTPLAATLPLPGEGWRGHPSLRRADHHGDTSTRLEGFFRGGDADDPDEAILVVRIHAPGTFSSELDAAELRQGLDRISQQVTRAAPAMQTTELHCALEPRLRSELAGACRGTGLLRDAAVDLYVYFWAETADDIGGAIYLTKEHLGPQLGGIEEMIRGIELQ